MVEIIDKYDHIGEFYQGVAIVVKDNLYGAVLTGGYEIVPPTYDYITPFRDGYAQAIRKGECRILDLSGRECKRYNDKLIAIPSKYDEVREFKDGYACVRLNGLWGAVDTQGNEIFAPQFYFLSDFVGGTAKYKKEKTNLSNSWGYVHANGFCSECNIEEPIIEDNGDVVIKRWIISGYERVRINKEGHLVVMNGTQKVTLPKEFILARNFSNGLARVQDSAGYWGYVNLEGKIVIPLQYTKAQEFHEDRAYVCNKSNVWCLISTNGLIIKTFDYLNFPYPFEKGYSIVWTNTDKRVILDHSGNEVSQHFDGVVSHTDYSNQFKITDNGLEGFYNVTTKQYIEPRFEKILEIHSDYVKIEVQNIGEVLADFNGRTFIGGTPRIYLPDWCLGAKSLTDKIYLGISRNKKYGLIDSKGETLCEPVIEDISEVDGDIVVIERFCKKETYLYSSGILKYGLYDSKRKVLIPADYDIRPELKDGYYLISKNGLLGILDLDGQQILKPEWQSITLIDNCFLVSKIVQGYKEYFGLVNQSGNFIIRPDYNEIVMLSPSIYKASIDKERWGRIWKIYDENGILTEESFDDVSLDGDTFIVKSCGRDGRLDIRGKKIVMAEDGTYVELPSKFSWGYDFKDGVARVDLFSLYGRDVQYKNHVDTSFNIVIYENDSIVTVDEGIDCICERNCYGIYIYWSGGKYGLLSPEGKILVKAGYDSIRTISEDLYVASIKDGFNMKSGVIDVNGNIIIDFQYYYLEPFYGRVLHSHISPDIKIELKDIEIPEKIEHLLIYNRGYGLIDLEGNLCISPGYKDIQKTEYGFILKEDNKYGYAALDYSIVCEPKYASIEEVGNGFKKVSVYNYGFRYGIIDQSGKECLEPIYISIGNMNEDGEAEIIAHGMKYGIVDNNYNIIKEPCERKAQSSSLCSDDERDDVLPSSMVINMYKFGRNICRHEFAAEGLVWIHEVETEKIGLATEDGKILIEPRYGKVEPFVNGFAKVNSGYWYKNEEYDEDDYPHWKVIRRYVDGKWGVINALGEIVIPTEYSSILFEDDGSYIVSKCVGIYHNDNCTTGHDIYGRLNQDGELIIKDENGEYILASKRYDWQCDFDAEGRSEVYYNYGSRLVNKDFQLIVPTYISGLEKDIIIPDEYDWWNDCVNGLVVVEDKEGKFGIINSEGRIVVEPIYNQIRVFRKGEKVFFLCDSTLADADGTTLPGASYKEITLLSENFIVAKTEQDKYALIDYNGQQKVEMLFDVVYDFDISTTISQRNYYDKPQKIENQKYAIVCIDGLYGLIDRLGKLVVVPKYKSLTILANGCFWGNGVLYDVNEKRVIVNGNSVIFVPDDYIDAQLLDNGLILASSINENGVSKWGCVNQVGTTIIPFIYNSLSYSEGLLQACICDDYYLERKALFVQQNKKYGVIDFKNEIIVPFSDEYEEIKIQANIILIKNKHGFNLWGAYTREGNLICEPKYNAIVPISEYALKVSKEEIGYLGGSEKWGIVDFTGKELIPIEYDWISGESDNGLLKIKEGYLYGFIDVFGNLLLKPTYYSVGSFHRGYAIVSKDEENEYGVVDTLLNEVIPCHFRDMEYIEESHLFKTEKGYKDSLGRYISELNGTEVLVPSKYSYCELFNNGLAIAVLNINRYTARYGLINDRAADVLPPIFESLLLLDNGFYMFKLNKKYGLIDNSGSIIMPNKYHGIGEFINNLALARVNIKSVQPNKESRLYGYVDLQGNEILPVEYEFIGKRFNNRVVIMKGGEWWLFGIDDYKLTAFPGVAYLGPCVSDDLCKVNIGGQYDKEKNRVTGGQFGYCSIDGKTVIEIVYDSAYNFSEGLAAVKRNGKWGFINTFGEVVVPCKYDEVDSSYKGGCGRLTKGQEVFVFDCNGNLMESYTKEEYEEDDYYQTYDDDTPSVYDNPYYNDNLDMDQQSIEFWNSI